MVTYKDNNLYSPEYEDIYFSINDALSESRHVFLKGTHLPERWNLQRKFVIAETGFGTGRNFLATWHLWANTKNTRPEVLHYISIEKHPLNVSTLVSIHQQFPELAEYANTLQKHYPSYHEGFHRIWFESGKICLTLCFGDIDEALTNLDASVDVWFLDGFSPAKNPEMWSESVIKGIAKLSNTETTLATYTAAGIVKRRLENEGFEVRRVEGHGQKKDMIVASMKYPAQYRSHTPWFTHSHISHQDQTAVVIGAGIAGAQVAERMAKRGWNVQIIDKAKSVGGGASGAPLAVVSPRITAQASLGEKFSLQCYLYQLRQLKNLSSDSRDLIWTESGVLLLAKDSRKTQQFLSVAKRLFPKDLLQWVTSAEASSISGITIQQSGIYYPKAGFVDPKKMIHMLIDSPRIELRNNVNVSSIQRHNDKWLLFNQRDEKISSANIVVLANGNDTTFSDFCPLAVIPIAGQTSYLKATDDSHRLNTVIQHDGYILPAVNGRHLLGSTYHRGEESKNLTEKNDLENYQKLNNNLPHFTKNIGNLTSAHHGTRVTTINRLPYVGPMFDGNAFKDAYPAMLRRNYDSEQDPYTHQGLFAFTGLGSRGLTNAALCAEHLVSIICNEPSPFPNDIAHRLHPTRDVIASLRQQPSVSRK